jgi:hypothetical protein
MLEKKMNYIPPKVVERPSVLSNKNRNFRRPNRNTQSAFLIKAPTSAIKEKAGNLQGGGPVIKVTMRRDLPTSQKFLKLSMK